MNGRPGAYGRWVWYPWSGRLVHVLPEAEFRLVRTDRNRDKTTRGQQQSLPHRRVGVTGLPVGSLSVGSSAATACATEGVGGAFRLADFDRPGPSNLNRLRAGVHELGVGKSVPCAPHARARPLPGHRALPERYQAGTTGEFFGGCARGDGLGLLAEERDTP
ncbi:hypothetical protein J3A78_007666 [Streptomyces sp. PvR006]|uniref:hypothetical protein n=1 Tax=Streptomyces sp. PvR006 TaxID=2817860 RepID=UPI001AE6B32B|nr:hypothetical protein [Streptomyces sp. PvR006]MBP2579529.1 hypothetical protein [Streptomyces sp. PvR006]MBP2587188.1 hypothetical protein [Streptomyces sp. PvR006]